MEPQPSNADELQPSGAVGTLSRPHTSCDNWSASENSGVKEQLPKMGLLLCHLLTLMPLMQPHVGPKRPLKVVTRLSETAAKSVRTFNTGTRMEQQLASSQPSLCQKKVENYRLHPLIVRHFEMLRLMRRCIMQI